MEQSPYDTAGSTAYFTSAVIMILQLKYYKERKWPQSTLEYYTDVRIVAKEEYRELIKTVSISTKMHNRHLSLTYHKLHHTSQLVQFTIILEKLTVT